jgi:hypothetical protein
MVCSSVTVMMRGQDPYSLITRSPRQAYTQTRGCLGRFTFARINGFHKLFTIDSIVELKMNLNQ